jgi:CRISPR-associated protein Cas2
LRQSFLVCYDISNAKRLAQVAKAMKGFGDRVQFSVFECQLTKSDLVRCRAALSTLIDHRKDQVIFVDLGPTEGRGDRVITALGRAYSSFDAPAIIVD